MEKDFKFIEPELIEAGSPNLGLGVLHSSPRVDCRVLSEDTYQELKKAYNTVCESQKQLENAAPDLCQNVSVSALFQNGVDYAYDLAKETHVEDGVLRVDLDSISDVAKNYVKCVNHFLAKR